MSKTDSNLLCFQLIAYMSIFSGDPYILTIDMDLKALLFPFEAPFLKLLYSSDIFAVTQLPQSLLQNSFFEFYSNPMT